MNQKSFDQWVQQIPETAASFPYPPTPDVASAVQVRLRERTIRRPRPLYRWAGAVAAVLVVLLGVLLVVPEARAAVWQVLQAGAIRIFVTEPTPISKAIERRPLPGTPTASQGSLPKSAKSVSLVTALATVSEPVYLPTYPPDLGLPDQVFWQETASPPTLIFVWHDDQEPPQPRLSLYQIHVTQYAYKGADEVTLTSVDGQRAFWVQGEHYIRYQDGRVESWQLVAGNVLIWWAETGVTYRLETTLSLAEAIQIAESFVLYTLPESEEVSTRPHSR